MKYLFAKWLHHLRRTARVRNSRPLLSPDPKATAYVWNEVFDRRIYAHESLKTADRQMQTVIDIGANVGIFAAWAAHEHHPNSIICYEASPITFAYLEKNVALLAKQYPRTTFEAVNAAVSNSDGQELTIFHRAACTRASTLLEAGRAKGGEPHKVHSVTLSGELARRSLQQVDLLKVDVEGHFMEVLQGVEDSDYQKIRSIVLECDWLPETGTTVAEPVSYLEQRGYCVAIDDPAKVNNVTLYASHGSQTPARADARSTRRP